MAGGQPRPNPTPPQRNRRTTGCTRTSRRASPSSCRPSDHPPDWATSRRLPSSRRWRVRHGGATPTQSFSTGWRCSGSVTGSPRGGNTTRRRSSPRVTPRRSSPLRLLASTRAGRRRPSLVSGRSPVASPGRRRCAFTSGCSSSGWPGRSQGPWKRASASSASPRPKILALRSRRKQSASWPV